MSDRHTRILHHIARQTQRELDHHNTLDHAGDTASTSRRDHLERAAKRARARAADAEQRRNRPRGTRPVVEQR